MPCPKCRTAHLFTESLSSRCFDHSSNLLLLSEALVFPQDYPLSRNILISFMCIIRRLQGLYEYMKDHGGHHPDVVALLPFTVGVFLIHAISKAAHIRSHEPTSPHHRRRSSAIFSFLFKSRFKIKKSKHSDLYEYLAQSN